ncbi:MAG: phage protein Gp36 family protein [Planctomycetota bacterium]|jgi:phage gp36-like protein
MGYISNSDIETRLGSAAYVQLTDDAGTGQANEAVVDEARAGAEGELDAYLARRYAVPIDLSRHPELTGILTSIALDLAEYRLRLRRPPISPEATARRDAAAAWLQRVASGEIELPAARPVTSSGLGGFAGRATGAERVITREDLAGF